ncbi:hypothetical protein VTL71DRAFT_1182 [Oculimacula yallundae]|uniref:chitinase n=1 Tax=Oculimacula yallundae TaxID=86028 RepID=A0ABR4D269_9HELO
MVQLALLKVLCLVSIVAAFNFTNGPGGRLSNGGHTAGYEPIIELSEVLIASELGENSTALLPHTSPNNLTARSDPSSVFRRQDNRPAGALKCSSTQKCVDGSCCGAGGTCGYKDLHCGSGCQSNCNAKAMCGVDSKDGAEKCGLQLCCSHYGWCGTKDVHCIDPEPLIGKTPCQQGFGGCTIKPSPECSPDEGGDSGWRRIAYYAGWNSRDRKCDWVLPGNINTTGLTHLMYSFVGFDPKTFKIVADPGDVKLFRAFTKLGSSKLKTWVAVGGWSFNDPGETATAYSDMVSTSENRAAFISSLIEFMDEYGFTGADIDWEYPSNPQRGGRKEDKENLVELAKDMKAAFGFRVSVVLAPDYWYLQGFSPAAMEQYVDHLGFMAYDLHGSWDSENALGSLMRPHTDIRDIDNGLTPLWFDGVNPKKVVMGIAYYGRTFTAASTDCGVMGCGFSGPGRAYGCTNFKGVLSNMEIRKMIKETGAEPFLLEGAMVKELVYDTDQWVAYDDYETIALKERFARKRCLGGTMIWSIDYDSPTSDNGAIPSTDGDQSCTACTKFEPTKWDSWDPEDLSSIKKLAAIGDSYSAGIGAGDRLGSIYDALTGGTGQLFSYNPRMLGCSRYKMAHPAIISRDSRLGKPAFQFKSCSGAVSADIIKNQIPGLDSNQDAILLSVGGNDVELVELLNQCIYQLSVLNAEQVGLAKVMAELDGDYAWAKDFDFDALGRGCEGQIARTQSIAQSKEFRDSLDQVVNDAKKKLSSGGKIYWTGYGKFFSTDSSECDKVTWTTWLFKGTNAGAPAAYLTKSRRVAMNNLVDIVNNQIRDAVVRAGNSVRFVDWDSELEYRHGRFCESGVDEATKESNSRVGLMFYELNSFDTLGNSPWKREPSEELQGTFMADLSILGQIQLFVDPNAKLNYEYQASSSVAAAKAGNSKAGIFAPIVDGYRRVFHPQIGGHLMIADLIIDRMVVDRHIDNGYEKYKYDEKSCELPTTPSNPTPSAPKNALNIILDSRIFKKPGIDWQYTRYTWYFYSVPYGTGSECSNNPLPIAQGPAGETISDEWPSGTFNVKTQDGDCQYKNDGKGNPGALWCGSTVHSCKEHAHKSQGLSGRMYCGDKLPMRNDELGGATHRATVVFRKYYERLASTEVDVSTANGRRIAWVLGNTNFPLPGINSSATLCLPMLRSTPETNDFPPTS